MLDNCLIIINFLNMRNILLLVLLALFAIFTHQQDYDEDYSHLRRGGRSGRGRRSGRGGRSGRGKRLGNLVRRIDGRSLSRAGHAITGGVQAVDTIKGWFGKHYSEDNY